MAEENCAKKIKIAKSKVKKLMKTISDEKLNCQSVGKLILPCEKRIMSKFCWWKFLIITVPIVVVYSSNSLQTKDCYIKTPLNFKNIFHKPEVDCSMCENITEVSRVENISKAEFEDLFAYSTTTVIVIDAAKNWPATKVFDFEFFKNLYTNTDLGTMIGDCAFFPYETEFQSLSEVFLMDEERARLEIGTQRWYIGWNTCYDQESKILRQYYTTPYFLPESSEPESTDWFFMGGPGKGAHMHIDHVRFKSWQTQLKGRKKWTLAPPSECYYQCNFIEFIVEPGETLIVDTNRWYHKTEVLDGDISLTIGAEYD